MSNKTIWITGASTGIGAETALQMAAKGWKIMVSARSVDKLDALSEKAQNLKGSIHAYPCDITEPKAINDTVESIEKDHGPIDIALLNAGTYFKDEENSFTASAFQKTFNINLQGTANCLEPLLKRFTERGKGHVAIVASVAGFRGLPKSLSYGPTKAALINLAEALYMDYHDQGIKVQVVNPGFVRTPLTDKNDFEMPMLMEVEDAAAALIKGLESDRFEIVFPWLFVYLTKTIGLLPGKLYLNLIAKATKGKR